MTVTQNVAAVLKAAGLPPTVIRERATRTIRLVGLTGFDDAFPRELSGGMKQRVGMARALSVDPELLFMDEPFNQVDALTAESLRAEVLDIWSVKDRNPSSVLVVSHDIKEVVDMADRIVLLGANPGTVRTVVENHLPRPRDYRSPELLRMVDHLHDLITGHEMPDVAPPPALPPVAEFEPLPDATPTEIVGLLEYLDARGGNAEIFHVAGDTNREFGRLITVVKAAELLDFVDTPKRQVLLTPVGTRFVRASAVDRALIWRDQLLTLRYACSSKFATPSSASPVPRSTPTSCSKRSSSTCRKNTTNESSTRSSTGPDSAVCSPTARQQRLSRFNDASDLGRRAKP